MPTSRTVLVVEDRDEKYKGIKDYLEEQAWTVVRSTDEHSTWDMVERLYQLNQKIDAIVIDLGLPPSQLDVMHIGLPLATKLRERFPSMPILAYTGLFGKNENQDFGLLLARFLPLRISLIHSRHLPPNLTVANFLEMATQGFVIISPGFADLIKYAIPTKPDPLTGEQWETLKLLSQGLTVQKIANELDGVGIHGVRGRLRTAGERLRDCGELQDYQTTNEDLVRWYNDHYARYSRD